MYSGVPLEMALFLPTLGEKQRKVSGGEMVFRRSLHGCRRDRSGVMNPLRRGDNGVQLSLQATTASPSQPTFVGSESPSLVRLSQGGVSGDAICSYLVPIRMIRQIKHLSLFLPDRWYRCDVVPDGKVREQYAAALEKICVAVARTYIYFTSPKI